MSLFMHTIKLKINSASEINGGPGPKEASGVLTYQVAQKWFLLETLRPEYQQT